MLFYACPRALPKIRKMYCTALKTPKIQTILYKTKGTKEKNGAVCKNGYAPFLHRFFVGADVFFFRFYDNGKTPAASTNFLDNAPAA